MCSGSVTTSAVTQLLHGPGVFHWGSHSLVVAGVGDFLSPCVHLGLKIGKTGEREQRKKRAPRYLFCALHLTSGFRASGFQDDGLYPEVPDKRGQFSGSFARQP